MPARPRLRATGTAVASPPSRTAGRAAKAEFLLGLAVDDDAAVLEDRVDPRVREVTARHRVVVGRLGRRALLEAPEQVVRELAGDDDDAVEVADDDVPGIHDHAAAGDRVVD